MILEILKAVAGFALFGALFLAVQFYLRRRLAARPGCDILEAMVHGCGNCANGGQCGSNLERHQS
ncbi:MAG: hypothetical protein R2729_15140 [Bryobacteraceae bacterium]